VEAPGDLERELIQLWELAIPKIIKRTKASLGLAAKRKGIMKRASNPGDLVLAGDCSSVVPDPVLVPEPVPETHGQFLAIPGMTVAQVTVLAGLEVQLVSV
jgi:hypothetical protein